MALKQSTNRRDADAEESKKRRISLKKEEMLREINFGTLNTSRGHRSWRDTMMRVKMPIHEEEVEVAWHTFNRSLDVKDHGASLMIAAVENAKHRYEENFISHTEAIDHFVRIYRTRLRDNEDRYRDNLEELVMTYEKERGRINERENENDVAIRSTIFNTKQHLEDSLVDLRSGTIAKVDILREENDNSRRIIAAILETELNDRWSELRGILNDYENGTKERRRAYDIIRTKDDRERIIIERQVSKTGFLFESIRKLKIKIEQFGTVADGRVSEITAEHKFFHDAYRTAKERFLSEHKKDEARLVVLTKEYYRTEIRLKKLVRKAEKILVSVHDCAKYETEDEKILQPSFIPDSLSDNNNDDEILADELRSLETTFWRRTGAATIITTELKLEKSRLVQELRLLRESLGQYLSDQGNDR